MRPRNTTSVPTPSLVLDAQPFARRARAWHALAALRTRFRRPAFQLFGGRAAPAEDAARSEVHVPEHLLAPHRSLLD